MGKNVKNPNDLDTLENCIQNIIWFLFFTSSDVYPNGRQKTIPKELFY